jgi:hypothetical protein
MKKIFLFTVLMMVFFAVFAQTPKISYQAVVRDADNRLVTNTEVTVDVIITYGSNMYSETGMTATTNANGLLSLLIGNASGYEAIDWNNATIKTRITVGGQTIESITPVTAVPYALSARVAADLDPNGATLTAVYNKIQADSATLHGALKDTANAIRNAIPVVTPQVNADWNATSGVEEILNKPSINDGKLTITLPDGTEKVFTANQAGNTEVVIPSYTVTPQDILDAAGQMTPEQKAAMRQALGVSGTSSGNPQP